jgi:hypothetical protein
VPHTNCQRVFFTSDAETQTSTGDTEFSQSPEPPGKVQSKQTKKKRRRRRKKETVQENTEEPRQNWEQGEST